MADTDFENLPASTTIAPTDSILIVRNGAAYRFTGTLPAVDASGAFGIGTTAPGAKLESVTNAAGPSGWSVPAQLTSTQYPLLRFWSVAPNRYGSIGFGDGYLQFFVGGATSAVGIQAFGLDARARQRHRRLAVRLGRRVRLPQPARDRWYPDGLGEAAPAHA